MLNYCQTAITPSTLKRSTWDYRTKHSDMLNLSSIFPNCEIDIHNHPDVEHWDINTTKYNIVIDKRTSIYSTEDNSDFLAIFQHLSAS